MTDLPTTPEFLTQAMRLRMNVLKLSVIQAAARAGLPGLQINTTPRPTGTGEWTFRTSVGRLTAAHQLTLLSTNSDLPTLRIRATAQVALKTGIGAEVIITELLHSDSELSIDLFEMLYGETCVLREYPATSLTEVLEKTRAGLPTTTALGVERAATGTLVTLTGRRWRSLFDPRPGKDAALFLQRKDAASQALTALQGGEALLFTRALKAHFGLAVPADRGATLGVDSWYGGASATLEEAPHESEPGCPTSTILA